MSMFRVLLLNKKIEWVLYLNEMLQSFGALAFLCLSNSVNRILGMTRVFGQSFQDQKYAQCKPIKKGIVSGHKSRRKGSCCCCFCCLFVFVFLRTILIVKCY